MDLRGCLEQQGVLDGAQRGGEELDELVDLDIADREGGDEPDGLVVGGVDDESVLLRCGDDRGGKAVKLSMREGQLELSVTNPDHGTASEELAVEFEPESFEIGFNARYLLDIIGQIRSENAVFLFNDAGSPTLVREDGEAKALYVLMPMRV